MTQTSIPPTPENWMLSWDPQWVRAQFPALSLADDGQPRLYLDNPAGTQAANPVLTRMQDAFIRANANRGAAGRNSLECDALLRKTRQEIADWIHAEEPEQIIFGPNMTSLTFSVARSMARMFTAGDEWIVTRLDHDANITPWVLAARERGIIVRWVDVHLDDGSLDLEDLDRQIRPRTRLIACGLASNALGTLNPIREIVARARTVEAKVFVDAVHYAPHGPIDVQDLGCDFLAFSAYKMFGPHVGVLYGRRDILDELTVDKVVPAMNQTPDKFEVGTQNHEGIIGILGILDYFRALGQHIGVPPEATPQQRRQATWAAIVEHEQNLTKTLWDGLTALSGVTIHGIQSAQGRLPTFAVTLAGKSPRDVAEFLADENIYVTDGHFYAIAISKRLGLFAHGGVVRIGAVHYNTNEEIFRLLDALDACKNYR